MTSLPGCGDSDESAWGHEHGRAGLTPVVNISSQEGFQELRRKADMEDLCSLNAILKDCILSFFQFTEINDRVICLSFVSYATLRRKWYRGEIWLGLLIPFLPRWLLRSQWDLRRSVLDLTHASHLPWVRKQGGIHRHRMFYLMPKARLKYKGACPRFG